MAFRVLKFLNFHPQLFTLQFWVFFYEHLFQSNIMSYYELSWTIPTLFSSCLWLHPIPVSSPSNVAAVVTPYAMTALHSFAVQEQVKVTCSSQGKWVKGDATRNPGHMVIEWLSLHIYGQWWWMTINLIHMYTIYGDGHKIQVPQ